MEVISIIFLIFLGLNIVIFKKTWSWNCITVFYFSNLIFVTLGIVIFPLIRAPLELIMPDFSLNILSNTDILNAQIISCVGLTLVLLSYLSIKKILKLKEKLNHLSTHNADENQINIKKILSLLCILLILTTGYMISNIGIIQNGLLAYLNNSHEAIITSRYKMGKNLFYFVCITCIIPFLTVILIFYNNSKKNFQIKLLIFFLIGFSIFAHITLYQKRPLIIFLLNIFIAFYTIYKLKNKKINIQKIFKIGIIIYFILLILFYLSTNIKSNFIQTFILLNLFIFSRIFYRLALPGIMYTHFFPKIENHYGFNNINKLTELLSLNYYPDTIHVYNYFSKINNDGTLAINSIFDFYGGFGWLGWIIGCLYLGGFLFFIDYFLRKLNKNSLNITLVIFIFTFCYYLSQATLSRSILGYGFIFFIITWLISLKEFKIKLNK